MNGKERFIDIYKKNIKREGADKLLDYLTGQSDFFTCPASARYHGAYEGGLCDHSLNVYDCLCAFLDSPQAKALGFHYSEESVALVALLHDLCKAGCYKVSSRNVKDEKGVWKSVPFYEFRSPALRSRRKIGLHPFGLYATVQRRGLCHPLPHGLFGH